MAHRFDATADVLSRTTDLLSFNAPYTRMGWVYLVSDTDVAGVIWCSTNSGGTEIDALLIDSDGVTLANYVDSPSGPSGPLTVGAWTHFAQVRTGSSALELWINGALQNTNTAAAGTGRTLNAMYSGSFGGVANPANIRLSGEKAWSAALSGAEVANEMRTLRPRRTANLYGWWPHAHSNVTDAALDLSGNGRNWTVGGTLTIEDGPPVAWGAATQIMGGVAAAAAGAIKRWPPQFNGGMRSLTGGTA